MKKTKTCGKSTDCQKENGVLCSPYLIVSTRYGSYNLYHCIVKKVQGNFDDGTHLIVGSSSGSIPELGKSYKSCDKKNFKGFKYDTLCKKLSPSNHIADHAQKYNRAIFQIL